MPLSDSRVRPDLAGDLMHSRRCRHSAADASRSVASVADASILPRDDREMMPDPADPLAGARELAAELVDRDGNYVRVG